MIRVAPTLAACVLVASAAAQSPVPDPHWGANAFPQQVPEIRLAASFNRFTVFSSDPTLNRFNDIEETSGYNNVCLSMIEVFPRWPEWSLSVSVGGGITRDQPTEWLQNNFIHNWSNLPKVPVDKERRATELFGGASLTRFFEGPTLFGDRRDVAGRSGLRTEFFVGTGGTTGTLYQEWFAHAGTVVYWPDAWLRFGAMYRLNLPRPGEAYPRVADLGHMGQVSLALVPPHDTNDGFWSALTGNPEFQLTFTIDSGLFVDRSSDPISMEFISFRVKWPTGLVFETWNDLIGGTDWGPTYGFMLSFDVSTFLESVGRVL